MALKWETEKLEPAPNCSLIHIHYTLLLTHWCWVLSLQDFCLSFDLDQNTFNLLEIFCSIFNWNLNNHCYLTSCTLRWRKCKSYWSIACISLNIHRIVGAFYFLQLKKKHCIFTCLTTVIWKTHSFVFIFIFFYKRKWNSQG